MIYRISFYFSQVSNTSTNYSLNASSNTQSKAGNKRMFQVRRTFLLIVTFDLIFMVLLWIIYKQVRLKIIQKNNTFVIEKK